MSKSEVKINNELLSPIEPLLLNWIACTEQYIDVWEGMDLPYWYNERANVSILSGAAWKSGWTAIEEYQVAKTANEEEFTTGRNDLYITNKTHSYCLEAKVSYLKISDEESKLKIKLSQKLESAISDVKKVCLKDSKLAAVFVAPYSKEIHATQAEIDNFIEIIQSLDLCAYAWCAPKEAQTNPSHDNKYYPLAALLLLKA